MKKISVLACVLSALLLLAACAPKQAEQAAVELPAETPVPHACANVCETCTLCTDTSCADPACAQKCGGHHVCKYACSICGLSFDAACEDPTCTEKCAGHAEEPYPFAVGDFITEDAVSIDTGTFVFDIGKGVYVPADLDAMADIMAEAIEAVSGLSFEGKAPYARKEFADGKVHMNIDRSNIYQWDDLLPTTEFGHGVTYAALHSFDSPGDLFFGGGSTAIHELSHMLMFRQSEWSHSKMLNEGFAEYTTYLALKWIEENRPEAIYRHARPTQTLVDMIILSYEQLYEQPYEYWFSRRFEPALNPDYANGFRFMAYLHAQYGDYSKWITAYEEKYPFGSGRANDQSKAERQIEVIKEVYGADVIDNFYPWLKKHKNDFSERIDTKTYIDLTKAGGIALYPSFTAVDSTAELRLFRYEDLYINIEGLRKYIGEYKGLSTDDLALVTSSPVTVNLYQADGSYVTVRSNAEALDKPYPVKRLMKTGDLTDSKASRGVSLDGISYIKLVGAGELESLEVVGSFLVR